jgi:hypothetical protein
MSLYGEPIEPRGFARVDVDELDGRLYFGSFSETVLDHWFYMNEPTTGLIMPGKFEKDFVIMLCGMIDRETRNMKNPPPIKVKIVNGLPVYQIGDVDD